MMTDEMTDTGRTLVKVYEIYIRTTPERLWDAINDPATRAIYHFGNELTGEPVVGGRWAMTHAGFDGALVDGEHLEVEAPHRLVQTMTAHWSGAAEAEGATRVTWEIEPVGDSCRLTLTHDWLRPDAGEDLYGGWPMILSGLKTWLETGERLTTPGSLMYGG